MARYVPVDATVSGEGFFSSIGKALASVGSSISRVTALSVIRWNMEEAPMLNGRPVRTYQLLISSIRREIASGEPWDLVFPIRSSYYDENGVEISETAVLFCFGVGNSLTIRGHSAFGLIDRAVRALNYVAADGGFTFTE